MSERSSSGACKKFSANVFDKNKCQNCFKPRESHQESSSPTSPQPRPTNLDVLNTRSRTTVKSGTLALATQVSTLPEVRVQKWESVWFVLYSSGELEWFASETGKPGQVPLGSINLDDCIGLTNAEVDTNEAFSIGIKTPVKTHYMKADNRLEMDNWCRVLKPFVIASPGYNFNGKSSAHSFSFQEPKTNSSANVRKETKSGISRTIPAPWTFATDPKTNQGAQAHLNFNSLSRKKWSPSEMHVVKDDVFGEDTKHSKKKLLETESQDLVPKEKTSSLQTSPRRKSYSSETYLIPKSPERKLDAKTENETPRLELELAEAKKLAKHSQGKAEMYSKNLTEARRSLQEANNFISIQRANIDSLKMEIETLNGRLRPDEDDVKKPLKDLANGFSPCNGSAVPDHIQSGLIELQSKLQENEKALMHRTRELKKANESRAKVAKHTRLLLKELETKLSENNRRISELEEQLLSRTLDLQYEKEERRRLEKEKGEVAQELSASKERLKQREVTKRSTELLQQVKEDHEHFKSVHKNQLKHQKEVEHFQHELDKKNSEIERLRGSLADEEKKTDEIRRLEAAYKNTSEELGRLQTDLRQVDGYLTNERIKSTRLENELGNVSLVIKQKDKELNEVRTQKEKLKSEIEKITKQFENQVVLLQEDNESTRNRLKEVEEELSSLQTETDGRNVTELDELRNSLEEWKSKLQSSEEALEKSRDIQAETLQNFNNEKNKRLKLERDLEKALDEMKGMDKSQEELVSVRDELRRAEEKLEGARVKISKLEERKRIADRTNEDSVNARAGQISELETKLASSLTELVEMKRKLSESEEKVISLDQELKRRLKLEEEAVGLAKVAEKNLTEGQENFILSRQTDLSKAQLLDQENETVVDAVKLMRGHIKNLESSLMAEKIKVKDLEERLSRENSFASHACTTSVKKGLHNEHFKRELEEMKRVHHEELEKLKESRANETQTLGCHVEEIRLKLTSKIILLQSDISELKSKHERELVQINEIHKQELEELRRSDSLTSSDEIGCLRERIHHLEAELQEEREGYERKINSLKSDSETRNTEEGQKNGSLSTVKLDELKEQHTKEIEALKENHRKELEENKSDMMMVLQALKSDSYQTNPMANDSLDMNDELKKLERHVETLKKEHEEEISRLNEEHELALQQLRSDMVTLLQVQESYRSPVSGEDERVSDGTFVEVQRQLDAMRESHEQEIREKDAKHREEVEQLKSDMLVAIQAASAVGNTSLEEKPSPSTTSSDQSDEPERVRELHEQIAAMEKEFHKERETLQNAVKKAESATKFGLRRNEEMSNKIYQMQREMEEIDAKYQKEIKLYKEAFDQEKIRKTTIGAVPGILAENESLTVKLQELELNMEQMQVRYDAEIKRYKEKFQQENVLTVEELQLKIKSLEDSIEQMRLEHDSELERYTKAVKRGKVSLAGTAKERDLERKIDDLESRVDVMRQKHREEVRKYRERLEDEMERHRKEVSESRSKLRKLEMDNRQLEDFKNKVTELENKTSKLNKELNKSKEQEAELTETRSKNRDLQRQVDSLKRKLEKFEESSEDSNEKELVASGGSSSSTRTKLSRRESELGNHVDDVFEQNNNSIKSEIGGYKLNPALKRPASVSAFPVQTENGSRRSNYSESLKRDPAKRRDNGGTLSNRSSYQSSYLKTSTSASSLK